MMIESYVDHEGSIQAVYRCSIARFHSADIHNGRNGVTTEILTAQ